MNMITWMTIGYVVAAIHALVHGVNNKYKSIYGLIGNLIGMTIIAMIWPYTLLIIIRKL